jgi:uncharacterized protein YfeS
VEHLDLVPEDSHPKAREALTDAFFWDAADPMGPFGDETGRQTFDAFRAFRATEPRGKALELLGELLEEWEIAATGWDAVTDDAVHAIGAEDELGLLVRDEAIIALAFAGIIVDGRVDSEVRRRALLALARQGLPALLHAWGDKMKRRQRCVERMREILAQPWS